MIFHVTTGGVPANARALELDVQVALRVDGFRWVCWMNGESPDPPRESAGRFLAREDDPLAHIQVPASPSTPLALQPYRHLPRYSLDAGLAITICDRIGLFRDSGVSLRVEGDGCWVLQRSGDGDALRDASLSSLLSRATLRYHTLQAQARQVLR